MPIYSEKMIQAQAAFDDSMREAWQDYILQNMTDPDTYYNAEKQASKVYAKTMGGK